MTAAVEKPKRRENSMAYVTMKELLEAGVHFGHQTKRWNPKMKPYIFGARNGIYIVDLQKTVKMFKTAYDFLVENAANGKSTLFVGTKKQARDSIYEEANRCEMFYVHNRWLGGMLTNFQTIRKSIERLNYLNTIHNDGTINLFPKKERLKLAKEREKLDSNLGGIRPMASLPGAIFIVDPKNEEIAVHEGRRLKIPIVAIVDTNCDPDVIDYAIPGNDDAIRAIRLFTSRVADALLEGSNLRVKQEGEMGEMPPGSFEEGVAEKLEAELAESDGTSEMVAPESPKPAKSRGAADTGSPAGSHRGRRPSPQAADESGDESPSELKAAASRGARTGPE